MARYLVIVESPAKVKTIKKFKGSIQKLLYKAAVKIQPLLWRKLWHAIW